MDSENDDDIIIADIKELQKTELELYNHLENNITNGNLTDEQQQDIINKIKDISNIKLSLYDNLNNNYILYKNNINSSYVTLQQQIAATNLIEEELKNKKNYINKIRRNNLSKQRLIEINTYYSKEWSAYIDILKLVFVILVVDGLLIYLLPSSIGSIIATIIGFIGSCVILYSIYSINKRSPYNFDEFNYPPYSPSSSSSSDTSNSQQQ